MAQNPLKKILIISYFFPPCNLTASGRTHSWAKWLHKYGYYPVIVSRKWEEKLKSLKDVSIPSSEGVLHEKFDTHEVYYLPYKGNLRDKIYRRYGEYKYVKIRQTLTFFELIFQFFSNRVIPYRNIYTFSKKILQKEKFEHLIISGNPFNLFKFGFLLHKKFKIPWTADYRDAWSTSEINDNSSSIFKKIIHKLDQLFESKWVSTAHSITASSKPIGKSIEKITGVKSFPIFNGIEFDDFDVVKETSKLEYFSIAYIGTLYDGQKIEVFCEAFKEFIDLSSDAKAKLLFPGLAFFGDQKSRVNALMKGYENHLVCSDRIPREEVLTLEKRAHLLLHVAWKGYKGIIASKIYEYIASGTKIIVAPSDEGAIEEIVKLSECGVVLNKKDEIVEFLMLEYKKFKNGEVSHNDINQPNIQQFSRQKQVESLVNSVLS